MALSGMLQTYYTVQGLRLVLPDGMHLVDTNFDMWSSRQRTMRISSAVAGSGMGGETAGGGSCANTCKGCSVSGLPCQLAALLLMSARSISSMYIVQDDHLLQADVAHRFMPQMAAVCKLESHLHRYAVSFLPQQPCSSAAVEQPSI